MCWIVFTVEEKLLNSQTVGPTEGPVYRTERLSLKVLVGYGLACVMEIFRTFPSKKKKKLILNPP